MGLFGSGGILPSIGGFMGDIATGGAISNAKSQAQANQANIGQAENQMAFQERMSGSAWQRGTEDMRKAGLNPALAYTQGPASAPSGAAGTVASERKGDIGGGVGQTAKELVGMSQQKRTVDSQTSLNSANTELANIQGEKATANAKEAEANLKLIKQNTRKAKEETKRSRIAREAEEAELPAQKEHSKIDSKAAYYDAIADRIQRYIPFLSGSAKKSRRLP